MKLNEPGRIAPAVAMLAAICLAGVRAEDVPRDTDLNYPEYTPKGGDLVISRTEYEQKLQGFWLGACIANWTGLRTENKRTTMPYFTDDDWGNDGRVFVLVEKPKVWGADDDTDIEYIYQSILDVNKRSVVTPKQIAEGWLKHIDGNKFIWVSNRSAVNLMRKGILPPETSNPRNNKDYNQIDAQLTTEIFGLFAPARPDVALKMAHMPIRTTAFTDAEWISEFYVIMHSLASRVDPKLSMKEQTLWLAERARRRLPAGSFPAKMYDFVKREYDGNPDKDNWEKTRDALHHRYVGQGKETDGYKYRWHIDAGINFGASLVSLLYGEGDYKRTVRIGALCGWDSDNPTATWGGLLGFMLGREGIEEAFPDKELSGLYRIGRTRINFPDRTPDLPGEDTFELMARRGVFVIDRAVIEEMGGGVDLNKNVWHIPNPTAEVKEAEPTGLSTADPAGTEGIFKPTWESLEQYKCPEWFRDAKLGIYVHWGVYSVAERGEWYGRNMYTPTRGEYRHHCETYNHPSEFEYRDFIPMWKTEKFDADAWLAMFKDAGARYFTPCAVHHDGFDLWDSRHNKYNSVRMGPKKDLIGLMRDASKQAGLRWGVTTHLARNYNWFQTAYNSDPDGPKKGVPYVKETPGNIEFYHENHGDQNAKYPKRPTEKWKKAWTDRVTDLIDNYDLDFLYFDGAVPFDIDDGLTGRKVIAHYYNKGLKRHGEKQEVVLAIKTARNGHGIYHEGIATLDCERHKLDDLSIAPWQTDDSIGPWGYRAGARYKSPDQVVDKFIDIVSKNGNLLLNVPPKADGTFDEETIRILRELGKWNRQNGEGVFATRPWIKYHEGDIRFTRSKDGKVLYAIFLRWPEGGRATIKSLGSEEKVIDGRIASVSVLGSDKNVGFLRQAGGLVVEMPEKTNDYAVIARIELDGKLIMSDR